MRRYLIFLVFILLSLSLSGCGSFWELVMTDEEKRLLRNSAREAAACQISRAAQAPMGHKSLYTYTQGSCVAAPLRDEVWYGQDEQTPQRRFYGDLFCQQPVQFQLTRYHRFCQDYVFSERLGRDQSLELKRAWTLNPASRFRLPLVRQYSFEQPFMTTRIYNVVSVSEEKVFLPRTEPLHLRKGSGRCELQMRIYKANPLSKKGKSLLVFHGGGGHQRGFHSLALESRIPEFTNQGFTVYMPFYRLLGEGDTTKECSNAGWSGIKGDAAAALKWVSKNQQQFGDQEGKISLLAQGSGALMAGWLMTESPDLIARSVMLYPILDSASLRLKILKEGGYEESRAVLERILKQKLEDVSDDNLILHETSLLARIAVSAKTPPPMFLLHGGRDRRVPAQQSILACSIYAKRAKIVMKKQGDAANCGASLLHLLPGAGYQLDYCLQGVECPAGDSLSRQQVNVALAHANYWLLGETVALNKEVGK